MINHKVMHMKMCSLSSEMMGDPDLEPELDVKDLGPLISQEGLEQLQNKYVQKVRVRSYLMFTLFCLDIQVQNVFEKCDYA